MLPSHFLTSYYADQKLDAIYAELPRVKSATLITQMYKEAAALEAELIRPDTEYSRNLSPEDLEFVRVDFETSADICARLNAGGLDADTETELTRALVKLGSPEHRELWAWETRRLDAEHDDYQFQQGWNDYE